MDPNNVVVPVAIASTIITLLVTVSLALIVTAIIIVRMKTGEHINPQYIHMYIYNYLFTDFLFFIIYLFYLFLIELFNYSFVSFFFLINLFITVHSSQGNLTCSENVAYDTASNTLRMSSQAKVTCTENIAYSTVQEPKDDTMKITPASCTVTYDEVTLK